MNIFKILYMQYIHILYCIHTPIHHTHISMLGSLIFPIRSTVFFYKIAMIVHYGSFMYLFAFNGITFKKRSWQSCFNSHISFKIVLFSPNKSLRIFYLCSCKNFPSLYFIIVLGVHQEPTRRDSNKWNIIVNLLVVNQNKNYCRFISK